MPFKDKEVRNTYMREKWAREHPKSPEEFVAVYLKRDQPVEEQPSTTKEQFTEAVAFLNLLLPDVPVYRFFLEQQKVKFTEMSEATVLTHFYQYAAFKDMLVGMAFLTNKLLEKTNSEMSSAITYRTASFDVSEQTVGCGNLSKDQQDKASRKWRLHGLAEGIEDVVNVLELEKINTHLVTVLDWLTPFANAYREHFAEVKKQQVETPLQTQLRKLQDLGVETHAIVYTTEEEAERARREWRSSQ